jgi:hypothetical protein
MARGVFFGRTVYRTDTPDSRATGISELHSESSQKVGYIIQITYSFSSFAYRLCQLTATVFNFTPFPR